MDKFSTEKGLTTKNERAKMLRDDNYYAVEVWNTQTGEWHVRDYFPTPEAATKFAKEAHDKYLDESGYDYTYSVVHFRRTIVAGPTS